MFWKVRSGSWSRWKPGDLSESCRGDYEREGGNRAREEEAEVTARSAGLWWLLKMASGQGGRGRTGLEWELST